MTTMNHNNCNDQATKYDPEKARGKASALLAGCLQKRAKCNECGRFVSNKELAKVPTNGVPWCDNCVSTCD